MIMVLSFSSYNLEALANASIIFLGKYRVTSYTLFESPPSTEYTLTLTSGGSIQTYYGTYTNTSLYIKSDMEFTGSIEGFSASVRFEDFEDYFDADNRVILHTARTVIKLNGNVESKSTRYEYGNYIGNYPTPDDIIRAKIGDQWNYTFELRVYENEKYEETSFRKMEITIKDFPTKVVEAGAFHTVRFEEIEWKNEVLYSKSIKWRRISDGKLIAHESYNWKNGEWNLSMKQELISEEETETTKEPTEGFPIIVIIGTALVVISILSFLTYRLLKRRKSEMSLKEHTL